ncbi:MAG: glycosyltransferase, partial [Polaromonas sp.]|nr:glycosyltransferase [Polaromonas sp.]
MLEPVPGASWGLRAVLSTFAVQDIDDESCVQSRPPLRGMPQPGICLGIRAAWQAAAARLLSRPMIGVVVPVHNEERLIARCIESIQQAARCTRLRAEPVEIVLVLDACTDASQAIASRRKVTVLSGDLRNVGAARALGAAHCLARK